MNIQDLTESDRSAVKLEILCLMAKIGVVAVLQAIADVANDCGDFSTLLWDGGKRQSTVENCYLEMVKS